MRSWLKEIRAKEQKTMKSVAERVGISEGYYSMIENGNRDPHPTTAKKIANILDFKWELFFPDNDTNESKVV